MPQPVRRLDCFYIFSGILCAMVSVFPPKLFSPLSSRAGSCCFPTIICRVRHSLYVVVSRQKLTTIATLWPIKTEKERVSLHICNLLCDWLKSTKNQQKCEDNKKLTTNINKKLYSLMLQHPDADSLYIEEIDVGEESM